VASKLAKRGDQLVKGLAHLNMIEGTPPQSRHCVTPALAPRKVANAIGTAPYPHTPRFRPLCRAGLRIPLVPDRYRSSRRLRPQGLYAGRRKNSGYSTGEVPLKHHCVSSNSHPLREAIIQLAKALARQAAQEDHIAEEATSCASRAMPVTPPICKAAPR
jgi:hypothetical protein